MGGEKTENHSRRSSVNGGKKEGHVGNRNRLPNLKGKGEEHQADSE